MNYLDEFGLSDDDIKAIDKELVMSTVNAGENVASAIDEYIDDNPEVVLPILVPLQPLVLAFLQRMPRVKQNMLLL
jgi:hypothetical protein